MSFIPLHRLLSDRSQREWERYWQSCGIEFSYFNQYVSKLVENLKDKSPQRIFLYHPDRHLFLAGLLAAFQLKCPVVLPPNNTKGLLGELMQEGDVLLSDQLDVLYRDVTECGAEYSGTVSFLPLEPDEAIIVFYTSGSTGKPKRVEKVLAQLEKEIASLDHIWPGIEEGGKVLSTVTHQHIYGFLFSLLWPVCKGCSIEAETFSHWEVLFARMETNSIIVSSPSHLGRFPIGESLIQKPAVVFSSSGSLNFGAAESSEAVLGMRPWEIYGSTETGGIAYRQQNSLSQVWTCFPGVEIFEGEKGRLCLTSPHLPNGYLHEADDRIKIEEGKGFHLLERFDRTVKIEGKRINLGELEEKIKKHCCVSEALAVALNLGNRDEIGALAVLTSEGLKRLNTRGKREFVKFAKETLRQYFESVLLPRRWRFVNELPLNDNGKHQLTGLESYFTKELGPVRHPHVIQMVKEGLVAEIELTIPPNLAYLEGHFKETSILPGVVQLHWAYEKAREVFEIEGGITQVIQLKFNRILSPGAQTKLRLEHNPEQCRVVFTYGDQAGAYSSGKIKYSSEGRGYE